MLQIAGLGLAQVGSAWPEYAFKRPGPAPRQCKRVRQKEPGGGLVETTGFTISIDETQQRTRRLVGARFQMMQWL